MKVYKNFTQTRAYDSLKEIYRKPLPHLKNLSTENDFIQTGRYIFDYSKTHFSLARKVWPRLLDELEFDEQRNALFSGSKLNITENRPALHTALRLPEHSLQFPDNDIKEYVLETRNSILKFTDEFRSGRIKGITGKPLNTVVNIGIGGSHLGPQLIVHALKNKETPRHFFLSNIDDEHWDEVMQQVDLETTLFVLVSKSFSTKETLSNAQHVKQLIQEKFGENAIGKHFIAVTSNLRSAMDFGIPVNRIFEMRDWIGGRYSLWSVAGISIPLILGKEAYLSLLSGASQADIHFKEKPVLQNIPVIMALLTLIYNNLAGYKTEAHVPYAESLRYLPFYLQQLAMESNGKSVQRNGHKVHYSTGHIVWGGTGTNAQHSFFQLLHQGTEIAPVYFTGYVQSKTKLKKNRITLLANLLAQSDALAFGAQSDNPLNNFEGNRPSVTFVFDELSPENLGFLLAVFEHKIFTESILWNINAFDQPGVELGKKLAENYEHLLNENTSSVPNAIFDFIKNKL